MVISMQFFFFNTQVVFITHKELTAFEVFLTWFPATAPSSTHPQETENSSQIVEAAPIIIYQVQSLLRKVQELFSMYFIHMGHNYYEVKLWWCLLKHLNVWK